tara:strand:- start:825 stop:1433 length:609 start_codon:yes stop_codon:yes gene_type:complete
VNLKKSILAKLLEQGLRILLIKECKKIGHLKINLIATSIQIIKGEIQKINIIAKDINYKYLLFDEVELEASQIKVNFNLTNKELKFRNNPIINFKISFSESSLKEILLSNNWNGIKNLISNLLPKNERLKDLKIRNNKLLLEAFESNILEQVNIKTENGKVYLVNKDNNKIIQIPIEDKIYIKNINFKNNIINIFANSSISF